ncbi:MULTISPECIES: hypothetical protein [Methanobacterium]|jgi:hypothetical protein|nr:MULTISPECIES: hypothetical protein [Methanobacterium]NMO09928.1 hypothetical protein [Methanobacterium subterraneum]
MNKKLLGNNKILEILVDSESIDNALHDDNEDAKRVLKYLKSDFLNIIRSPFPTSFKELQLIPKFIENYDKKDNLHEIEIIKYSKRSKILADHDFNYIKRVGQKLFDKKSLNEHEINALNLFFVHVTVNKFNRENIGILLTNNGLLLKNRLELYHHASHLSEEIKDHLDILSANESRELIGLFLRYHHKYLLSAKPESNPQYGCNRGSWYWYLFRSKIPHFHVGVLIDEPFLDAFSTRFVYLLRSVDEIGFQYYKGVNNDTLDDMMYHFNYAISLITGIFDSLALITKNKYNLEFKGDKYPHTTSLNPKAGRNFLKAVRETNPELRNLTIQNVEFIKNIYFLRELIIHRETTINRPFSVENGLKMGGFEINKELKSHIRSCGDKKLPYISLTNWGVHETQRGTLNLEPFHFIKAATNLLAEFSNRYLELLGFNNFLEDLKSKNPNDRFLVDIRLIKEDGLTLF